MSDTRRGSSTLSVEPYYVDDFVTIYHGDARDILPALDPVELVVTDPPYGVGYVTSWRSRNDALRHEITNDEDLNALRDVLPMLDRLLKDGCHAYAFASHKMIGETQDALEAFWTFKNVIAWDKGEAGTVGDLKAGYGVTWEAIVYAAKGKARPLLGPRPRSIIRHVWSGTKDPVHPTVKPVGVMAWLIAKSSHPGETVLDPFMGSGPTLRAAKDLGRRAIGIEIEERYCEVAARRLSQEALAI